MTGVTGVVSVQYLCVFTGQYLNRGGAAHLINLAVRLENGIRDGQYGGM